jgi:hypothetical protein
MTEDGESTLTIHVSTSFTSSEFIEFAGFELLNSEGEVVAVEGFDFGNVTGFGANYSGTRILYFEEFFSLPFEGSLLLYEGYFNDNSELVCSFPINFSLDGSGVSLEGQYFIVDEYDFIEFTSDSLFVYDFEEEMECYEFIEFVYLASDSVLVFSNDEEEESIMVNYSINGDNINLFFQGDSIELTDSSFESSKWEECDSVNCTIYDVYAEAGECDSLGYFMVDVEFVVINPSANTFTIQGNGTNYGSFEYEQESYQIGPLLADGITEYEFAVLDNENQECSDFYELGTVSCEGTTGIRDLILEEKKLLLIKNILGETVNQVLQNKPYIYF